MTAPLDLTPWTVPTHPDVALHAISADRIADLADGDAAAAGLPASFVGADLAGLWQVRHRQLQKAPEDAPWITRLLVTAEGDAPLGVAGFHGPPDEHGMVEVGYWIDPTHRRHGYAAQALDIMVARAGGHPDVHTIRATISPDNSTSLHMVDRLGFRHVGEQWDDEDGLEIIYELDA